MIKDTTARDVADWMLGEVLRDGSLAQAVAAEQVVSRFGERFVYYDRGGSRCIDRKVREVFGRLSSETVVWDSPEKRWRKRRSGDVPGRRQPPHGNRTPTGDHDVLHPQAERQLEQTLARLAKDDKKNDKLLAEANDVENLLAVMEQAPE